MKKIVSNIATGLMLVAVLDLAILSFGLLQITYEGRSGYWSPYWKVQADAVMWFTK